MLDSHSYAVTSFVTGNPGILSIEINFHPLFPQFFDPHIILTASQQAESKCTADYLNGLPISCHARESYKLAIEFVRDTPERSILKARLFEIFVLTLHQRLAKIHESGKQELRKISGSQSNKSLA